ncbi:acetyltransferase [Roseivivax halodurans JCM 10272]|uniref:Acetyltransferase n=1 Tax=Roseivivax halodurans JCM 10272 TaxID=1449350 RepID=X7EHS7_9RHOB|nr:GNAT family N-acetyltransferase [Roseivivax halodurans]ETX15395.1 acetyltransferase [Roseivivax halodurans JCM 10272]
MNIRPARPDDAAAISAMLTALTEAGLRTRPSDEAFVRESYIGNPQGISCLIAEEAGAVIGLQVLSRMQEGNEWGITPGEGSIGTHVHPEAERRGIARSLLARTLPLAREAALPGIVATIGADNALGLAYYEAMGFSTIEERDGRVLKRLAL